MDDGRIKAEAAEARRPGGFARGAAVLVVLHSPREKCWGVLDEINASGVYLRGLDLNAFDDWTRAVANDEPFVGLSDVFFPMWRVERLTRDERAGDIPSLVEQFETRTRRSIEEFLR